MQNVPENSAKTLLTWSHFKTDHGLRREENKVEFLEGRFLDEKLPFLHKKKAEHTFELSLVLKHGDRAAAILLKMDIRH